MQGLFPQPLDKVEELLKILSPKQQKVIRARFGLDGKPKTLKEVGRSFGATVERARQIQNKALRKLRYMKAKGNLA